MSDRKIFFAGSIRAGREDESLYMKIIEHLRGYGQVLTEFVGFYDDCKEVISKMTDKDIHDMDVGMLEQCSCVVAEVTIPSHGVGYEIGRAVAMGKSILCLYRPESEKKLSAMLRGAANGTTFIVKEYSGFDEVPAIIKEYLASR